MSKLSVVISVHNGERVLEECLRSVVWADEIVVIDYDSDDATASIAKKYTKVVVSRPNDPHNIDLQKNYGFEIATNEWILSLDADERVSADLAQEIKSVINTAVCEAYEISRKNIIFGKWIQHSLWWPDYQVRLFKKGKAKYVEKGVHKQLKVDGSVGKLQNPLIHENYQSVSQYIQKMDVYTENEALSLVQQGTHFNWRDALRMPVRDFLKTFFLQEGYKDGFHGLVLSTLQGFYTFLVIIKVWEKNGFKEEYNSAFLKTILKEWRKLQNEVFYWILSTLIISSRNPFKKFFYRIKRKIVMMRLRE